MPEKLKFKLHKRINKSISISVLKQISNVNHLLNVHETNIDIYYKINTQNMTLTIPHLSSKTMNL